MKFLREIWYAIFGWPYDPKSDLNSPEHDPAVCPVCKSIDRQGIN
jgi:hypothetical protein